MIPQLDYLAAEGLIKERLQDQVDQVPDQNVLSATDLDGVKEKQQAAIQSISECVAKSMR